MVIVSSLASEQVQGHGTGHLGTSDILYVRLSLSSNGFPSRVTKALRGNMTPTVRTNCAVRGIQHTLGNPAHTMPSRKECSSQWADCAGRDHDEVFEFSGSHGMGIF